MGTRAWGSIAMRRCLHCQRVLERIHPKYVLSERELAAAKFCSMKCFGEAKKGKNRAQFAKLLKQVGRKEQDVGEQAPAEH
jgi:hypothetical protein